jgi:hypothetical protein
MIMTMDISIFLSDDTTQMTGIHSHQTQRGPSVKPKIAPVHKLS